MHSGRAFAKDGWEVARKNGWAVLISAAKTHDFKVLLEQICPGAPLGKDGRDGEERS
jgi:hypothetical protein